MQNTSSNDHTVPYNPLSAMQRLRPDLLGFVFHLSWMYLLLYGNAVITSRDSGGLVAAGDITYLASATALAAVMAVGILRTRRFMQLCESRAAALAAPALTALGTVLYCANQFTSATALVIGGGLLTGLGSGVMAARWASVFGGAPARAVVENLPTLLAIIAVICASVNYVPYEVCLLLVVALPLLSGAALQYARTYQHALTSEHGEGERAARSGEGDERRGAEHMANGTRAEGATRESGGRKRIFIAAEVALVALLGFTIAMLPAVAAAGFDYSSLFYALSGAFVLLFCAISIARADARSIPVLFVIPTLVLVAALLPLLSYGSSVGAALNPVGNIAFELVLLFGTVLLARAINASPARMFMIGRLTLAVFDLAGSWLGLAVYSSANQVAVAQTAGIVLFAACELLLFALVVAFLMSGKRFAAVMLASGKPEDAGITDAADTQPQTESHPVQSGAAAHAAMPEPGQAAAPACALANEPAGTTADAPEPANASTATTPAPEPASVRLDVIAAAHGLSDRERDVFALLAEGRTNARIGEDLCIAAGTVNYHTRNIYHKLGVHSRQELIDMVRGE